jgi:hypothetical protein
MKKLPFLFLILAIVVLSGCVTGPTAPGAGAGITILSFQAIPTQVASGDNVQLALQIQNQGSSMAKDVKVRLFGIDPSEWEVGFTRLEQDIGDMLGAREGVPGETKTIYWTIQAPSLPVGISQLYEPIVRIYYRYTTTAVQQISIVSESEFKDLYATGQTLPIKSTVYTQGPLTLSVTNKPVYASENWQRKWFPISVKITNTGNGVLRAEPGWGWAPSIGGATLEYPVKVKIEMPPGLELRGDCADYEWGKWVSLFQNKEYEISCDVYITRTPEVREDKTIKITLEYDYYISTKTQITVQGRGTTGLI